MSKLTEQDYTKAAHEIGCEIAAIKAFASVESKGHGFYTDGKPVILFEAHVFARLTGGIYNVTHPRISSPVWRKSLYIGGPAEHIRLSQAALLDRDAALQSTSWGLFQIMGFNWKECGYETLQHFINDIYESEGGQLRAFVGYIKSQGLAPLLQKKQWPKLAARYNGPGYKKNNYDKKLEAAYKGFLS